MKPSKVMAPVISLFFICLIVTAALAFTYNSTKDIIAETKLKIETEIRQEIFPQGESFEAMDIPELSVNISSAYKALGASGETMGYIISALANGYGGAMEVLVAVNADGSIKNVRILSDNETPGLGKNAAKESFVSQYYLLPQKAFTVVKNTKTAEDEILALSGATISSKAVTEAVNAAYQCYTALGGVS